MLHFKIPGPKSENLLKIEKTNCDPKPSISSFFAVLVEHFPPDNYVIIPIIDENATFQNSSVKIRKTRLCALSSLVHD